MSRKLKQNILPHVRRQVHAIVGYLDAILALQGQMASPVAEFEVMLEGFEAADALALQNQVQAALHEHVIFQLLDL